MNWLSKRIRLFSWVFSGFVQKQKKALVFSTIIGISFFLLLKFFMPYIADLSLTRQKTRVGMVGNYMASNLPPEILSKLSYGLLEYLPDGSYKPLAAAEVSVSGDFKTYRVVLKNGLSWVDGKAVRSDQLKYSINGVTVSYPNRNEIVFTIDEPFAPFLTFLEQPLFRENLVGFGSFSVRKIEYQNRQVRKIVIFNDTEEQSFRFYASENELINAFRLGEIDQFTSSKDNLLYPVDDKVELSPIVQNSQCLVLYFNTANDFLSEKSLRQALAYGIKDKSFGHPPCYTSIKEDSFAFNEDVKKYDFDADKAADFLKDIDKDTTVLKITTIENYLPVAESIKKDWEELFGLKVEIEIINFLDKNFQILLLPQTISTDPDQYTFWHSTQENNITQIKNPKIDKLLEDGRLEHDLKERAQIYQELQKTLSEELPALYLYHPSLYQYKRN